MIDIALNEPLLDVFRSTHNKRYMTEALQHCYTEISLEEGHPIL